jgi:hypothetical protein
MVALPIAGAVLLVISVVAATTALSQRPVSAGPSTGPSTSVTGSVTTPADRAVTPSTTRTTQASPTPGRPTPSRTTHTPESHVGPTFGMSVGDGVTLTRANGERFKITLNSITWRETGCGGDNPEHGSLLITEFTVEVLAGTPFIDLWGDMDYFNSSDVWSNTTYFTGCEFPALILVSDSPPGTIAQGRLVYDVASPRAGRLRYGEVLDPSAAASWIIPG